VVLEDFEEVGDWDETWGYNVGNPPSGQIGIAVSDEQLKIGGYSGKIHYIFDETTLPENVSVKKDFSSGMDLSVYNTLGFWVYGDSLYAGLQISMADSTGQWLWRNSGSNGTIINFNGWKKYEIAFTDFQEGWPQSPADG
jgi:hypothetical protein